LAQGRKFFGNSALLKQRLCLDLQELKLDELVVGAKATKIGKNSSRFFFAIVVNQPSWGERHEYHANEKDRGRPKLKADWNQPRGIFLMPKLCSANVVSSTGNAGVSGFRVDELRGGYSLVNPEAYHDAKSNGKLLKCDQSTSHFGRSTLGIVDGNHHRQASNPDTPNIALVPHAASGTDRKSKTSTYVMKRPARIAWYPTWTEVAWITTPTMKTDVATRLAYLREIASARNPESSAPSHAPSSRIDVNQPFFVWLAFSSTGS